HRSAAPPAGPRSGATCAPASRACGSPTWSTRSPRRSSVWRPLSPGTTSTPTSPTCPRTSTWSASSPWCVGLRAPTCTAMPRELRSADPVPKLLGADIELGNFILGLERPGGTGYEASRALLHEIDAPYVNGRGFGGSRCGYDLQDWGRKYLSSNGG